MTTTQPRKTAAKAADPAEDSSATPPAADDTETVDVEALKAQVAELTARLAATTGVPVVAAEPAPAPVVLLDPPDDLPAGFVFNRVTGQQWCGQCAVRPLEPSATSFACDHGAWQGDVQFFQPAQ